MELVLETPRQRWIYENVWPHPGSRFGNEWEEVKQREKFDWMYKTWAQRTGFSPAFIPEEWTDADPRLREAAQVRACWNRKRGVDEQFGKIDFIDLPKVVYEPEPEAEQEPETSGVFGSLSRKEDQLGKYIVVSLAVIAGILILKLIL